MNGLEVFDELVWSDSGTYFICFSEGGRFQTRAFESRERATSFARQQAQFCDVWFAPAVFEKDATRRKAAQAKSAAAFWIDLDVGEGKDYPSIEAAVADLKRFCVESGMPKPAIICSGNGIHAYWLLSCPLEPEAWKGLAEGLKAMCDSHGLKADPSRTADIASLMRLPGTANHKGSVPKQVELLAMSGPYTADDLPIKAAAKGPADNNQFDIPVEHPPYYSRSVADGCAQIAAFRDSKGNVPEPLWYACLGVLAFCEDGEHYAHEWSSGYAGYSERETDDKLEHWKESATGATTCSRFASLNPEGCEGCPFAGKLTSPIRLGTIAPEPETDSDEELGEWERKIPPMWSVSESGVYAVTDDGPEKVLENPIIVVSVGRIGYSSAEAVVKWKTPLGKTHQSEMPLSALVDDRSMTQWLLDRAITGYTTVRKVRMYLKDYIQNLQRQKEAETIINRFGWADSSFSAFFLGDREVLANEVRVCKVASNVPRTMADGICAKGSLEEWAAATELLDNDAYFPYALAVLVAAASPLIEVCGVNGAVLSLAGKSGIGKTTSSLFGASIFGEPESLVLSPQGTLNSKGEFFRIANNLPIVIDDIISSSRLTSPLVYMAANGRAKERLTRSGDIRGQESWALSLITTTNTPLYDLPPNILGEAEKRRVLEFQVTEALPREVAERIHATIAENYGVVAEPFLRTVISAKDKIQRNFDVVANKLFNSGIEDSGRFSVWMLSAAKMAGDILRVIGAIKFDHKRVVELAAASVKRYTELNAQTPANAVREAILSWINSNIGNIAVSKASGFLFIPDRQVLARAYADTYQIAIPASRVKAIVHDTGLPGTALTEWKEEYVVGSKNIRLGGGKSVAERCYLIKLPSDIAITFQEEKNA